jgi:hypothetical protein
MLQDRIIGKWFLEAFRDDRGVVIAITGESATTVEIYRSPINPAAELVSNIGHYAAIPSHIRAAACAMLRKWERKQLWEITVTITCPKAHGPVANSKAAARLLDSIISGNIKQADISIEQKLLK